MTINRTLCTLAAAIVLPISPGLAHAEDAISHLAKKPIGPTS
jgi:hypothetical protein